MEKSPDVEIDNAAVASLGGDSDEPSSHMTTGNNPTPHLAEQSDQLPHNPIDGETNIGDHSEPTLECEDDNVEIDGVVLDRMTTGMLGLFLPNLQRAKGSLNEVLHNQEVLIETLQQENAKFADSVHMQKLTDTMADARLYHTKLVNLKKEMAFLSDKSTKLKSRAVKLQQQKQREEYQRAAKHERELEKERRLTAKVARQRSASSEST